MYDNFYTKYKDAKIFINSATAEDVIKMLSKEKLLTAEQCVYLSKAYVFADDGKKAVKFARKAVKINPEYAYGYIRLSFALGRMGKKKECLKNLELAEKFGAEDWLVQTFLACIYNYVGDFDKSSYYIEKLLECGDKSPAYYYNVGFVYYAISPEDYEKAIEYFKKAGDFKDRYNLNYKLMECYGELGDIETALGYLEKCLSIKETPELLERQIQCMIFLEKYEEAERLSRKYYRKTDDKQQALRFLAVIAKSEGQYNKALRYLRFADYTTEATEYLYELTAEIYEAKKDYYSALDFYKKALRFDRYDDEILLNISYCYSKTEDFKLADKYADMAIAAGSPVKINGQNVELWSETSTAAVQIPYVQAATDVSTVTDCYFVDDTDGTLMAITGTEPVTTLKLSQCTDQTLVLSGGVGYIAQSDGSSADLSKPVYTKTGSQYTVTPAVEADSPSTRIGIVLKGSVLPNKTVEVLV